MSFTETTTTSYGSRIKNSLGGIGTGFLMFIMGTCLLWWNEGRAVKTSKLLEEAQSVAKHVDDVSEIDPSLNGQLIHATAQAETSDILQDDEFGYSAPVLKLCRNVAYYQYIEQAQMTTKDKIGGSQETTTTYTYNKSWTSSPVNSSEFADSTYRGKNFTLMRFADQVQTADNVYFGAYRLTPSLISDITGFEDSKLVIDESMLRAWDANISRTLEEPGKQKIAAAAAKLAEKTAEGKDSTLTDTIASASDVVIDDNRYANVHVSGNVVYFGKNPSSPQIGDVMVTFSEVKPGTVSLLAKVSGDSFEPFTAKNGKQLSIITAGDVSMEEMFNLERQANNMWLWICRLIGTVLICIGLQLAFSILSTLLKVLPFLANIMNWGVNIVCTIIGIVWALLVIAIAWIFYRPWLGIAILVLIAAIIYFFVKRGKKEEVV